MPPVRCFTCGAPLGHLWEKFKGLVESGTDPETAMNMSGVKRYCCRRTLATTVVYIEDLAKYSMSKRKRSEVIRVYFMQRGE